MENEAYIIDRFEGDFAVCETDLKKFINIDRAFIPPQAKEGDTIVLQPDSHYVLDDNKTRRDKERIARKMDNLWE